VHGQEAVVAHDEDRRIGELPSAPQTPDQALELQVDGAKGLAGLC
jgi:hypothetical protein